MNESLLQRLRTKGQLRKNSGLNRLIRWETVLFAAVGALFHPAAIAQTDSPTKAGSYYIDYMAGTDTNNGLSTNEPWQHHPYMQGWTGGYTHSSGDQFTFRGGVTWPSNCFPLQPHGGGSSAANMDYYGVNSNWFTGSSFTRPVFDGQYNVQNISYSMGSLIVCNGNDNGASFITFNSLELRNVNCGEADNPGLLWTFLTHDVTMTNCWLHGWTISNSVASDGHHGGWINFVSSQWGITNMVLDHCEIENQEHPTNGVCVYLGGIVNHCLIHDNSSGVLFAQDLNNSTVYNITASPFDGSYHCNGFYMDDGNGFAPPTKPMYCRNTIFHDVLCNMAYPNPWRYDCYIYNCLFYGQMSGQLAIQVDAYSPINQVPNGSSYGADGTFTVTGLTNGVQYYWTPSANDYGCAGLAASGLFTATGTSQVISGKDNAAVTCVINNYTGHSCYVYNNTIVVPDAEQASGIRIVPRPGYQVNNLFITNNFIISDYASLPLFRPGLSTGIANEAEGNNLVMATNLATAAGYTAANLYQPTSASSPTVGAGTNLMRLGLFTSDIVGSPRPALNTNWDKGAYHYISTKVGAWPPDWKIELHIVSPN